MVYDAYNLSLINGSSYPKFLAGVNEHLMFGWYGVLVLLTFAFILFMSYVAYSNNVKKSLGLTSLFVAVLSVGFRVIHLVSDEAVVLCWVIAALIFMLSFMVSD